MRVLTKINVYSNYFTIHTHNYEMIEFFRSYARRFNQWKLVPNRQTKRFQREIYKTFYLWDKRKNIFRFHRGCFTNLIKLMTDLGKMDDVIIEHTQNYFPEPVELKMKDNWTPRDYQEPAIDFIIKPLDNDSVPFEDRQMNFRLMALKTGRGKTSISAFALEKIGQRVVAVLKPMYIDKWIKDVQGFYHLDKEDLMSVSGGDQLRGLISLAKEGNLKAKIILISNATMRNWLNEYEQNTLTTKEIYGITPDEFFPLIKAGVRLIDEVHQDFHFNFMLDLYTHVPLTLSLSATLDTRDDFLKTMYNIAYPSFTCYKEKGVPKHIDAVAVIYSINSQIKMRTTEFGSNNYSHNAFEKSILKNRLFYPYMNMIKSVINYGYINGYKKGDKCAVFASSIDMCTRMTTYLKNEFPHLDVRRYVQDDPYENVTDADIRVTTILSGGTAVDIPGLTCSILTIAIDSLQSNLQTFGRLRPIKDRQTRFFYLSCSNINKHNQYHERRKLLLKDEAKSYREYVYQKTLFNYQSSSG